jgi:signal transduction histidine kinase
MSSQRKTELAVPLDGSEQVLSTAGVKAAYFAVALGYLMGVLAARHLTGVNFLAFTALQVFYVVIFRWLVKDNVFGWQLALNLGMLTGSSIATGLLSLAGVYWDWLPYLVTAAIYFTALSLRTAIVAGVLLYLVSMVNLGLINKWDWPTIYPSSFTLLAAFGFIAAFSLVLRVLEVQKERAERLLHQLEESNAELEQAHAQLRSYAMEVEELTIVRERARLAREIHDTLGHYLSILNIQLETIGKLQERAPARAIVEIAEARRVAAQSMQEVRNAVAALRPMSIATLGLTEAIRQLGKEFELNAPETILTLDLETELPLLTPDISVALYRAAQEAFTNIRKHAQASKVLLRLRYEDETVELLVLDNGCGTSNTDSEQRDGFGLIGLRERTELLGGYVSFDPVEQGGYRLVVRVPIPSVSHIPGELRKV